MTKPKNRPYTRAEAINALERLAERWPRDLWLLATPQSLWVAETGPDGKRVMGPDGYDEKHLILPIQIPVDAQS